MTVHFVSSNIDFSVIECIIQIYRLNIKNYARGMGHVICSSDFIQCTVTTIKNVFIHMYVTL